MWGAYFGNTYWSPTYWGTGGNENWVHGPKDGEKARRQLTEAEIDGLKVIYGDIDIPEEVEYEVTEVDTQIGEDHIQGMEVLIYDQVYSLTKSERLDLLQETDDIALILAIIESLD